MQNGKTRTIPEGEGDRVGGGAAGWWRGGLVGGRAVGLWAGEVRWWESHNALSLTSFEFLNLNACCVMALFTKSMKIMGILRMMYTFSVSID